MGKHYLNSLFEPQSVAVFGASDRVDSVGQVVFANLLHSDFTGEIYPINPNHQTVQGHRSFPTIAEIPRPVDLAVIATPPRTVPDLIEDCGRHGVKAAVILTAGFAESGPDGQALEQEIVKKAQQHGIRMLGPNCLGLMRPSIGLNATFNKGNAASGNLAFVSQSGALCTAILDWAQSNDIGFSTLVSLGSSADVDFGEILDYLISDGKTRSILLYIEGIRKPRSFMSAIRAAAMAKPVILVKVGRNTAASKAALTHTASLVGSDDVFDAAIRRAGVVRVQTITQLFVAAKAMSAGFRPVGNRLAIVTNGGGPGVMATDRASDLGVTIAPLSESTIDRLSQSLPPSWSHGNPVDIIGDAQADRYRLAVKACLDDPNVDGVLVILTPQAMTKPLQTAESIIELSATTSKPLLACWMGVSQVAEARAAFTKAKKPNFRTPEPAVEVFSYLTAYYKNQTLLKQTPGPLSHHLEPDIEGAKMVIDAAMLDRRPVLNEMESKALLAAFYIPVARTMVARNPNEALLIAEQIGFPVAMKVNSKDITHKTDAGGVRLNLCNAQAVRSAYQEILAEVSRHRPNALIDGISIEPMIVKPNGRELMIGVSHDPVFGPVISFGAGGTLVEAMGDRSVALPPLNAFLARDLIERTKIAKTLGPFRHMPPADTVALESTLLRISEMVCELPLLKEMDINPLIVDEEGVLAADARIVLEYRPPSADRYAHMAIHPYPSQLVSHHQLADGKDITIRPIRPEDAEIEYAFVHNLSAESRYFRFMHTLQDLTPEMLVRFTQIDYSREMALIAVTIEQGVEVEVGVTRFSINPDGESCEFAVVVADSMRGMGLGQKLLTALMDAARSKGLKVMTGEVLIDNVRMLKLAERLGFTLEPSAEDRGLKVVSKQL